MSTITTRLRAYLHRDYAGLVSTLLTEPRWFIADRIDSLARALESVAGRIHRDYLADDGTTTYLIGVRDGQRWGDQRLLAAAQLGFKAAGRTNTTGARA